GNGRSGLDDHEGVRRAIGYLGEFAADTCGAGLARCHREERLIADEDAVARSAWRITAGRMGELRRHLSEQRHVVLTIPGLIKFELLVEFVLPDKWEDRHAPAQKWLSLSVGDRRGRQSPKRTRISVHGESELFEIVVALRCRRCAAQKL